MRFRPEMWLPWKCKTRALRKVQDACQDVVDHIVPPGYFFELRHMPNAKFLCQYNKKLAQQVAMGSQLRLRFEQYVRLLKKARAQIARHDQRIQVRKDGRESAFSFTVAIMLDDDCIMKKDLSLSLIGRVKEFASLANIKSVFNNEGFIDISIRFMGELWIMLDFPNSNTRDAFKDSMGVTSWFSVLQQASMNFFTDGRIVWVEVEGVPFKLWTDNTFNKIAKKWSDLLDIDDQEDTCYHSKRLCIFTKMRSNVFETFKVIFRRKVFWIRAKEVPGWVPEFMEESDDESIFEEEMPDMEGGKQQENTKVSDDSISREHPPGFTPKEDDKELDHVDDNISEPKEDLQEDKDVNSTCSKLKSNSLNSVCSGHFKVSNVPKSGGSILNYMEELVKVGQTMGYKMEGCENDIMKIIEAQGDDSVHR
nr:glucose-methanol-choline oxidoreductase, FAD/NAD(P)-binding domain protein [Tanacetum cinerariifolium]